MKYVSGRIVWGTYTWLGWSGEVAERIGSNPTYTRTYIHPPPSTTCWTSNRPVRAHYFILALPLPRANPTGINTLHNPAADILHSPAYEDGTDSEFRNVGS